MLFDKGREYAITYKSNQQSFEVYKRKFYHEFKAPVISQVDFEGAIVLELELL